jgi:hypothetical protein
MSSTVGDIVSLEAVGNAAMKHDCMVRDLSYKLEWPDRRRAAGIHAAAAGPSTHLLWKRSCEQGETAIGL